MQRQTVRGSLLVASLSLQSILTTSETDLTKYESRQLRLILADLGRLIESLETMRCENTITLIDTNKTAA